MDFDKYAVETYNANFEHPAVCDDIKNVDINQIEAFDLLLGGFPCQLGFGSCGSVQLAKCLKTGETVAIKKVNGKLMHNEV